MSEVPDVKFLVYAMSTRVAPHEVPLSLLWGTDRRALA